MSWLFFALLTALLWGVGQIFLKKGFSNLSSLWSAAVSTSINLLVYVPFALLNNASIEINPSFLLLIFCITFLYIFFFYAIEKGKLAFAGTVFATYPVITIILSMLFLHEIPSAWQFIMIALILFGGVLLGYFGRDKEAKVSWKTSWLLWAVIGSITTGSGDFLAKVAINNVSLQTYNFYFPIMYAFSLALFWFVDKKGRKLSSKINLHLFGFTIIGVIMLTTGLLSFNYALSVGNVSLTTTISSSYAGITLLLSYLFLKEKINKSQLFALSCIIIGIIFIGIS